MDDRRTGDTDRRQESRGGGRREADGTPTPLHHLTTKQRQLLEAIDAYAGVTGEACTANYLAQADEHASQHDPGTPRSAVSAWVAAHAERAGEAASSHSLTASIRPDF
jgi:hypothetical protein